LSASAAPKALILAAGLGTRLRPLTYLRAKAAVPVNGDTLIRRVIGWLSSHDVTDLVVNLHHNPESIAASVGDGGDLGARVRYSWENPVLGSAGGPRHAMPLLAETAAPFLIVNGDTLTDLDVRELCATHDRSGAWVTMALIPNPRPDKYGGVLVQDGYVAGFTKAGAVAESYHFIGVQVARPEAFDALPDNVPAESVNALYPRLMAARPHVIAAHVCHASFRDIGTPADYLRTSLELAEVEGDRLIGERVSIAEPALLTRTVVWDDVRIDPGVRLDSCIVCDGAHVASGASFERCAILPARGRMPQHDERLVGELLTAPIR
jgi:mannose-1-phosphate guanylyltransferase